MNENNQVIDNLKKYGSEFQIKCISGILSDKSFLERLSDIIDPTSFESDAHQWIVKETVAYFMRYKDTPTLNVFKIQVDTIVSEDLKKNVIDQLRNVYQKITDSDIKFVKEQYLEFCKSQKLKHAIFDSVKHLKTGNYEQVKALVDSALKAGMERNIGHDYMTDVEKRMSVMARNTIKTNWTEVDTIMDGGLAAGELGIITACAGSGKCIGPNTEIEIEYHEFGIETTSSSGKVFVLWINPFEKYKIDETELFGWQVENVFYEIEKIKDVV